MDTGFKCSFFTFMKCNFLLWPLLCNSQFSRTTYVSAPTEELPQKGLVCLCHLFFLERRAPQLTSSEPLFVTASFTETGFLPASLVVTLVTVHLGLDAVQLHVDVFLSSCPDLGQVQAPPVHVVPSPAEVAFVASLAREISATCLRTSCPLAVCSRNPPRTPPSPHSWRQSFVSKFGCHLATWVAVPHGRRILLLLLLPFADAPFVLVVQIYFRLHWLRLRLSRYLMFTAP